MTPTPQPAAEALTILATHRAMDFPFSAYELGVIEAAILAAAPPNPQVLPELQFAEWLNERRDLPVMEAFHDIVQHYSAALAQPPAEPVQAVPDGFKLFAVYGLPEMMAALERADAKGYLPDAMLDAWTAFDYRDLAAPSPQPERAKGVEAGWYGMDCAPLDGTLVRLLVAFDNHGIEDTEDPTPTIGSHNDGEWNFVGWDWHRDEWTRGSGDLLGWLPIKPQENDE